MSPPPEARIHDLPELRDRTRVFDDRTHAGEVLAGMLGELRGSDALVLGIPAGGVPVAAVVARVLQLELDVAVVSKVLLPWTTEAGYGAVAFDGSVWLDAEAARRFGLTDADVQEGTRIAREKVERRLPLLRGDRLLRVAGRTVVVVDDGIAAGSTLRAAVGALRRLGAARIVVAVPTGHGQSVRAVAAEVDALYCANVRQGPSFAVADAYRAWSDVPDEEVVAILQAVQ